ncbi:MAG: hypothetical protein M0Q95_12050 [Porticoccaceae bacterium]|nr:hypothetical protein [Porticoccaceae bacterium]
MGNKILFSHAFVYLLLVVVSAASWADGFTVDKVYHPYVEAMEQEIEWRVVAQSGESTNKPRSQLHRFAYGRAFGDRWFGEFYVVGEKDQDESLEVSAYEIEAIYQLSEQGEYWADWGLIFELEKEDGLDIWEAGSGILVEKEHGRWSTTANLLIVQEWGQDIDDEIESSLAVQTRYRYSALFEPAIEFHSAQNSKALGPVFLGDIRLGSRRNLHWELGAFAGLESDTPDYSFRGGIEFEF